MIVKSLSEIAAQYIGIKEISGNNGWDDKEFERKMKAMGWRKGLAYCAFFVKLCAFEYYSQFDSGKFSILERLFSPMAVVTYQNFKKAGYAYEIPSKNCLVVWQTIMGGEKKQTGHIAVFKDIEWPDVITIDGNTNLAGSRDGDGIYQKRRNIKIYKEGLNFIGFINLPEYEG